MNYLITVVAIAIVSLLLANPLFLQTQNPYEKDAYGQGYDVVKDSKEAKKKKK